MAECSMESLCTKISEVNLSAFINRQFHEDFSPSSSEQIQLLFTVFVPTIEEKSS